MSVAARVMRAWSSSIDDYPTALECSADGRVVAVGSASGELWLFNAADGELRARWQAHEGAVQCLAWNPRSLQLASGGQDGHLRLWRDGSALLQANPLSDGMWIERVAFNAQGSLLAAAAGSTLTLLASDDAAIRGVSAEHQSTITGVAWRPNGEQVVTSCYGGIQFLLAPSARMKRRLRWQGSMLSLALSPDGRVAACGCQDNTVHFWRLANESNAQMAGYPSKPTVLSWSADGRWLATDGAASLTVWSFVGKGPEGTRPIVLKSHDQLLTAVTFAPRGASLASGCREGRVVLWEPGRVSAPLWSDTMSVAVAHLRWASCDGSLCLIAADEAGHLRAWQLGPLPEEGLGR